MTYNYCQSMLDAACFNTLFIAERQILFEHRYLNLADLLLQNNCKHKVT